MSTTCDIFVGEYRAYICCYWVNCLRRWRDELTDTIGVLVRQIAAIVLSVASPRSGDAFPVGAFKLMSAAGFS